MNTYMPPYMEVVAFEVEDVLTFSNDGPIITPEETIG